MITVKIFNSKGKKVSERSFKSVAALSAYYNNRKHPDLPEPPDDGCWNCLLFDPSKYACTKEWNNNDPSYYIPDRDDKCPDEYCDDHDFDPDAEWEEGGDE